MKKRGVITEYLPWILISLAILVVLALAIFILKGKGFSLIDSLGKLFRGR